MNHTFAIRAAAALLSCLTLAGLISCGGDTADPSSVTENAATEAVTEAETEPLDSLSARKLVSDDVPELDFGGKDFRIFYQKRYTTDAIAPDGKESGDVLNDAVFRRNQTVEERFNVKIVGIEGEEDAMVKTLMNAVAAGEDAYEIFMGHSMYSGKAALAGYFYNWYDIPHIRFDKPWFPQVAMDALNINERMYMTVSDMCLSFASNAYCIYFNKQLLADYDITGVYDMVRDGTWTLDTLAQLSADLYRDINGDGQKNLGDQFGFGGPMSNHTSTWMFACDVPTVEFGDDGTVTSVFASERAATLIEKLRDLYKINEGSLYAADKNVGEAEIKQAFMDGNVGFITQVLLMSESTFRDVEFDYGIVPYPKFDEAQEGYYTIPGGSVSCLASPVTAADTELVGAVTAALSRESWVSVIPDYYDIVLKVKGARDEASIEMLDLVLNGRAVTTAFLYDSFSGYTYQIGDLLKGTKELASFTKAKDKSVIKHYEKVMALFYSDPIE